MGKWEIYGLVLGMNGGRAALCDCSCCGWTKQGAGVGVLCSPWAVGRGHCSPVARLETQRRLWPCKGGVALARAVCEDVGHRAVGAPWHTGVSWGSKGGVQPKNPKLHWEWVCSTAGDEGKWFKGYRCGQGVSQSRPEEFGVAGLEFGEDPSQRTHGRSSEGPWHSRGIALEYSC